MDQPYAAAPGTPTIASGGTLPAGTYSVRAAYTYAGGVGIVSPSVMVTVTGGAGVFCAVAAGGCGRSGDGMEHLHRAVGNENLQNSSTIPIGTAFTLKCGALNEPGDPAAGMLGFLSSAVIASNF